MPLESGYSGVLVSLGGIMQTGGTGRESNNTAWSLITTTSTILETNPKRIAALFVNQGPGKVWLSLKATSAANEGVFLAPNGSFQIDQNLPWTGCISAITDTNGTILTILQISVF